MPTAAEPPAPRAVPPAPFIEIGGLPRERGRQYGEQARTRILRGIEHYSVQLEGAKLGWPDIEALVRTYEPTIAAFEPSFIDEMRGIAEGAGVDYAAIVMLNARTELLKLADRRRKGEPAQIDPDGCTGLVVMPAAARAGQV